jgi:hypothetical protein
MPYKPDVFAHFLEHFDLSTLYPTLIQRLHCGFPLGHFLPLDKSYVHRNHPSTLPHANAILAYLNNEVSLGRMSGPYTPHDLESVLGGQYFTSCPLGVVEKAGEPGKIRITRDLSFKGTAPLSVNDQVDPDEQSTRWGKATDMADVVSSCFLFLYLTNMGVVPVPIINVFVMLTVPVTIKTEPECQSIDHVDLYSFTSRCPFAHLPFLAQVATAPPGSEAATLDIEAAYRTCPALPDHKHFIVCGINGMVWLDHTLPWGIRSAHWILGEVIDASLDIIECCLREIAWHIPRSQNILSWSNGTASQLDPIGLPSSPDPAIFSVINWESLGVGHSLKWVDDIAPY